MIHKTIQYIKDSLKDHYPLTEINSFIRIILEEIAGLRTVDLYSGKDIKISGQQLDRIPNIVGRLTKFEPIQYIIGYTDFYGLRLKVESGVLIPRPETEELVDLVIKENEGKSPSILDIGTGSGCIAVSLAAHLPDADVSAWDISDQALKIAMENAAQSGVNIHFEQCDIFKAGASPDSYDIIISNPPYVTESDKTDMEPNVLNWEPELALYVPDEEPLRYYSTIAEFAHRSLVAGGVLYFEINHRFGNAIVSMLSALGYKESEIIKDMSGRDRIIKATR